MAASKGVKLGDISVTVRELTFAEVRDWMVETEHGGRDALHVLAMDECGLDELARMSDAPITVLEACTPSDLVPLIAACKELNPHFFRVRAALSSVARMIQAEAESLALNAPPSSS